jgi:hypothetical protein
VLVANRREIQLRSGGAYLSECAGRRCLTPATDDSIIEEAAQSLAHFFNGNVVRNVELTEVDL